MNKIILFFASGLGSGFLPFAPGTWATAVAALIYWFLLKNTGLFFPAAVLLVFFAGVWLSGKAETIFQKHDDGRIVIDEIMGFWAAVLFLPARYDVLFAAFIFFRFFDVYKPLFINRIQNLPAGWGIMADDLLAGIYTNLVIRGFLLYMGNG